MFMPRKTEIELESIDPGMDKEEQAFEQKFLKDLPHLRADLGNVRIYRIFRQEFSDIRTAKPENLTYYIVHPGSDISLARAFELPPGAENVTWLHSTEARKEAFEQRGHHSEKGKAGWHVEEKKADVVVILDNDANVTRYLLRNVAKGGYILLPLELANEVLATGDYDFKMIIGRHGSNASVDRGKDAKFWEEAAVKENGDFKKISEGLEKNDQFVTNDEAFELLKKLGRPTDNVLEQYLELIEEAKKQKQNISNPNAKVLRYVVTIDGVDTIIPLKTRLPLAPKRKSGTETELAVFRKHESV